LHYSAIIDNTSLVYLTHLHGRRSFFENLRNLFHALYVPMEVKNEYAKGVAKEPAREWLLDRLKPEQGFFRLCTAYDSVTMLFATGFKGMDKGEAEGYAQFKKINAQIIISDDKGFVNALKILDPGIRVFSTLHLICWLDISMLIPDWNEIVKKIHQVRPFNSTELHIAYNDVLKKFGLNKTKKEISKKCSLKGILGTS
jgi:predicted nucleic acid-binding protein